MTAMERVAWTDVLVALLAMVTAVALYPWLGSGAAGAFGVVGLVGFSAVFLRRRGAAVIADERDRAIDERSRRLGMGTAWVCLLAALISVVVWSGFTKNAVPTAVLNWLIWWDFALCYLVKGLVSVMSYRRQAHAAQG